MERPLVWITMAYTIGIIFGKVTNFPLWMIFTILLIFLIITFCALLQKIKLFNLLLLISFLLGILSYQVKTLPSNDDISLYADKGYLTVIGCIDGAPSSKNEGISFPLKVKEIRRGKNIISLSGRVYVAISDKNINLQYGDEIKARGVLSEIQNYSNPLMPSSRKIYSLRATFFEKLSSGGGNPLKKCAIFFSRRFNEVLIKILPQKEASLLGSVLLGSSVSPLPQDLKNEYRKAGLIHLLVVSGTQVSILIGVGLSVFRALNCPLGVSVAITSFFNLMLVIITGGGASILRAGIMGEITLIGLLFERRKEFYTALAISALVLLIANPLNLFDIGFQLSFAATWALVYIAPVLEKRILSIFAISLAPIMATSPIIAFYFSQISLGAILSNLIVLPWVEFMVILGFSTTLLGFFFLPLAQVFGGTIWLALLLLDWIAKFVSDLPGACFYIKAPTLPLIIGYYLGLIALVEFLRRGEKLIITKKRLAFLVLFFISIFVWNRFASAETGCKNMTVTFLDVGQGDSILIETPGGKKVLIDGGGVERMKTEGNDPIGEKVVVPFLHRNGINKLDLVVLTHPHADHLGGLNNVLEEVNVDQVLDGGQVYDSQAYERFKALIEANKIKYSMGRAGQVIDFGENLKGYILNPSLPFLGNTNSDSIVMRLVYGDVSFLFTGDLEKDGEERVLQSYTTGLHSGILKVGHHGSLTSTSDEFLRAVDPEVAIISVGKHNRYRHPSRSTLQKLEANGIKLYRTDENGAVTVITDGKDLTIEQTK